MRPRRDAGFTLLELMIAMALFAVLGVALVGLITSSFNFLTKGSGSGEVSDQIHVFENQFTEDVRSIFVLRRTPGVAPDVRMIYRTVDWPFEIETEERGQTRTIEVQVPVLAFVRTIKGEEKNRVTRMAGTRPGGNAYLDQDDDEREARQGMLLPLGNLQEVLYACVPDEGGDGTTWSIVRAIRSPIGEQKEGTRGPGSLLDPDVLKTRSELESRHCVELLSDVLFFDVQLWGATTETWDDAVEPRARGKGGPFSTWDSTRGILPATGDNGFIMAAGADSLDDPLDDVFPRRIRARVSLASAARGSRLARLVEGIGKDTKKLVIDPASVVPSRVLLGTDDIYLKVGLEWLACRKDRGADSFRISQRGARGTPALSHRAGERAHYGETWEVPVLIPAFREELLR